MNPEVNLPDSDASSQKDIKGITAAHKQFLRPPSDFLYNTSSAAMWLGITLPALPLTANAEQNDMSHFYKNWDLNAWTLVSGAAALLGTLAFVVSRYAHRSAKEQFEFEQKSLTGAKEGLESTVKQLTRNSEIKIDAINDILGALSNKADQSPREILRNIVPILSSKLDSREFCAAVKFLPTEYLALVLAEIPDLKDHKSEVYTACREVGNRQPQLIVELFAINATEIIDIAWGDSSASLSCDAESYRNKAAELLSVQREWDEAKVERASKSSIPEFRMIAARKAASSGNLSVLNTLTRDPIVEIRDTAWLPLLHSGTLSPNLLRAIGSSGQAIRTRALELLTPRLAQIDKDKVVSLINSHADNQVRICLFDKICPELTRADLDQIAANQSNQALLLKIAEAPACTSGLAASCINRGMERIKVIDREEEYHYSSEMYSMDKIVDIEELAHNEFSRQETDRVVRLLKSWDGPKVTEFFAELTDTELTTWLRTAYQNGETNNNS